MPNGLVGADGERADVDRSSMAAFKQLGMDISRTHVPGRWGWCVVCASPRELYPCPPLRTVLRAFPFLAHADLWVRPDMMELLCVRDVAGVYRFLQARGVSQRCIAAHTQQSQSEVSEILAGRRVESYTVLARIAEGLGIPRGLMGLAFAGRPDPDGVDKR